MNITKFTKTFQFVDVLIELLLNMTLTHISKYFSNIKHAIKTIFCLSSCFVMKTIYLVRNKDDNIQ